MPELRDLRVTHVITSLGRGGAEQMLCKLLHAMVDVPVANEVVVLGGDMMMADDVRASGVRVVNLGMSSSMDAAKAVRGLLCALADHKPHVVQSWLYHADLAATVAHALSRSPARLVWNLRCSDMELERYAARTRLVVSALRLLSTRPDLIIGNSRASLDAHLARGYRPRRTEIIPNGFDTVLYRPNPDARLRLRTMLNLPADALVVGTVARVDPMKDYPNLLAAIEQMSTPDVHLVLIGDGTDRLVTAYQGNAFSRMFGLGARTDVPELMPGFDLFCLPSAFGEGFPNVLGEAMACGIACVATDVGGSAEVIGHAGRVVSRSSSRALAAALDELLLDADARTSLGALGRRRVEKEFDIRRISARYVEIYCGIVNAEPGRAGAGKPSLRTP